MYLERSADWCVRFQGGSRIRSISHPILHPERYPMKRRGGIAFRLRTQSEVLVRWTRSSFRTREFPQRRSLGGNSVRPRKRSRTFRCFFRRERCRGGKEAVTKLDHARPNWVARRRLPIIVGERFHQLAHYSFCSQHDLWIDARGACYDRQRRQQSNRQQN
jgi:hypothetical protein